MPSRIVDTHPHIISPDTARYPISPLGGKRSDWSAEHGITFEELVTAMDDAGVDKAAIVHSSTTYGFNNAYVVDSIARDRKRFTGVFSVDITQPDAPQRMREWVDKGMTGMRIWARGSTLKEAWLSLDDPATFPAWECAGELGISVATNQNATGDGLRQMASILKRFPAVKLFIDHIGRPKVDDGPPYAAAAEYFRLADFPNCYVKFTLSGLDKMISGKASLDTFVPRLVSVFGANRIAWGSNYPSTKGTMKEILQRSLEAMRAVSETDREWILGRTAQALYPALQD